MLPSLGGYLVAGSNVNLERVEKFIKEVGAVLALAWLCRVV
jgi:hypothetical protein